MIFRVARTSEEEPPCPEAKRIDGWATEYISAEQVSRGDVRNLRDSGLKNYNTNPSNVIMAYEEPRSYWAVEFATLEDFVTWVKRQGRVIIQDLITYPKQTYWLWLPDCETKIDGWLEIYDDYRE